MSPGNGSRASAKLDQLLAEPCERRCRECSRCIRYAAAWRNRRRYGRDDYPGERGEIRDNLMVIP